MKKKLKYGLTAFTLLGSCNNKESIQRPSIGGVSYEQNSGFTNSNTSDTTSDSTSEIDSTELNNYQYYPLSDKTWAIAVGNNRFLKKLTVPKRYQGRMVTQIIDSGFKDCISLKEISIPDSVASIGRNAFSGCSALSSIAIPEGITSIEDHTFLGCSALESIVIPDSVTSIGRSAFENCTFLTSIVIPDGVTKIKSNAFRGCTSLTSIVIPESVTAIRSLAFEGCTSLTSIVIPNGVTEIGDSAFEECTNLTICCKAESEPCGWYKSWNPWNCPTVWGYVRVGTYGVFEYAVTCKGGVESITITGYTGSNTSITIPETINGIKVTAIANSAFRGCSALTSIVIPDGVTKIGDSAFEECTSLTSIVIPNGVTEIGDCTFWGCKNLTICCKAESEPSGWNKNWNLQNRPVVWGYEKP